MRLIKMLVSGGCQYIPVCTNPTGWIDPLGLLSKYATKACNAIVSPEPSNYPNPSSLSLSSPSLSIPTSLPTDTFFGRIRGFFSSMGRSLTAWHFEGRDARNGVHPTFNEVVNPDKGWIFVDFDKAIYHQDYLGPYDLKFVYPSGREAVFNGDCLCPETRPQYRATYNYINPGFVPDNWYDLLG